MKWVVTFISTRAIEVECESAQEAYDLAYTSIQFEDLLKGEIAVNTLKFKITKLEGVGEGQLG